MRTRALWPVSARSGAVGVRVAQTAEDPRARLASVERFTRTDFSIESLRKRSASISVVFPALNERPTIAHVTGVARDLQDRGLVDEVIVVDGGSTDGTPEAARAAGAAVVTAESVLPEFGPLLGKGDSMWRG